MGQVRCAGWAMAIATAVVSFGLQALGAGVAADKPASLVVYPKVQVNTRSGIDTIIRLTNANDDSPITARCYYLDANSHCSGGTADGAICTDDPAVCSGGGFCVPDWRETYFSVVLTQGQPLEWKASEGLGDAALPLPRGVCEQDPFRACGSDADCVPVPGGKCTQSNAGTLIPAVPEDPFAGELRCVAVNTEGVPIARDDLKGEAILTTSTTSVLDVASYNAIGVQATGASTGADNELVLGGPDPEYGGCPDSLILNHFFEGVRDPVPGSSNTIETNLVLVPCSQDLARRVPGSAVVQYLVFNEFEQRFSASKAMRRFQDLRLCNIDTPNCSRSIFHASVAGTVSGQTRINAIGVPPLPSAILGIGVERHRSTQDGSLSRSAAFNLHIQGTRGAADVITIP